MDWCAPTRHSKDKDRDPWDLSIGGWWSQSDAEQQSKQSLQDGGRFSEGKGDRTINTKQQQTSVEDSPFVIEKDSAQPEKTDFNNDLGKEGTVSMKDGIVIIQVRKTIWTTVPMPQLMGRHAGLSWKVES